MCYNFFFQSDLEAAQEAEMIRRALLEARQDFTFETALSTERNLLLLEEAKKKRVPNLCSICAYKRQCGQCTACTGTGEDGRT